MALPIRFERPPVVEVVFGVLFDPRALPLLTSHFGLYWQKIRNEFPRTSDNAPIAPVVESFGLPASITVEMGNVPPLRRVWFVSEHGRRIIQVQEDRFHYNWKLVQDDDRYPGYDWIVSAFEEHLDGFKKFVIAEGIGRLEFRQFELTYVNHVIPASASEEIDYGDVLVGHAPMREPKRFLPKADGLNFGTAFTLPDAEGRLHVKVQTAAAKLDQTRILRIDLTARGAPKENINQNMRRWFDLGHDWITNGFVDLTSESFQKRWGRLS